MSDYLLDTNILIHHLRGNSTIGTLITSLSEHSQLYISVLTRTEILVGMHPYEESVTMTLLNSLLTLPIDSLVSDRAGRLIYDYARRGVQISFADALIGAVALAHHLILVTTNSKHFPMPELQLKTVEP